MGRPKGSRNKPTPTINNTPAAIQLVEQAMETFPEPEAPTLPDGWSVGALLNVRNTGADYCITLYPEEYDYRHPERAIRFTNPAQAQDFISQWYARTWVDPRA